MLFRPAGFPRQYIPWLTASGVTRRHSRHLRLTWEMDDPNIIAILIATTNRAERAFQFEHNKERYEAPANDTRPFSRENTPYLGEHPEDEDLNDEDETAHRLKLSFDKPPKNVNDGYVCGWGPDCDIQLVDRENLRPRDRKRVGKVS